MLYTDGVSEAANAAGEQFDEERLYEAVAAMPRALSAREVAERLLATLRGFLDGTEPQDDVTLLVVRVPDSRDGRREHGVERRRAGDRQGAVGAVDGAMTSPRDGAIVRRTGGRRVAGRDPGRGRP